MGRGCRAQGIQFGATRGCCVWGPGLSTWMWDLDDALCDVFAFVVEEPVRISLPSECLDRASDKVNKMRVDKVPNGEYCKTAGEKK